MLIKKVGYIIWKTIINFFLDGKEAQAAFGIMQDKIKELNNANTILQAKLQIAQEKLKSLDDKQPDSEDAQQQ